MQIEIADAAGSHEYRGKTYYFCNPHCLEQFRAHPEQYLRPKPAPGEQDAARSRSAGASDYTCPMHPEVRLSATDPCPTCGMALEPVVSAPPVARTEYVCPMHPQVVQSEPGSCPICGMALEPRVVSVEEEASPELVDMTRRFWISLALSVPLLLRTMFGHLPGMALHDLLTSGWVNWVELALATPVVLWGGWPFFVRCWASFVNRSLNMFTLIAIGTGTAYAYSVAATVAPDIFPADFRMGGTVEVYFEAAAVITTLVLLG
jgi:Cu+-exporting ATPase